LSFGYAYAYTNPNTYPYTNPNTYPYTNPDKLLFFKKY
jgi:hypothetical protein